MAERQMRITADNSARSGTYSNLALLSHRKEEFVIDLVLAAPWRRLRIDANAAAFSLVEVETQTQREVAVYRAAWEITRLAPDVPANPGVRLLARDAPSSRWAELTFRTRADFDRYTYWLLQLVRHGLDVSLRPGDRA